MCLVSLVLDIRLNTLTFKFLTISGTHSFACGLLILLQLPLNLLVIILKGKKIDSLLFMLTTCGLILHSWLFNDNANPVKKMLKNANSVKNTF